MGVFLHQGELCRGQGVHRAGQGVAGTPSTSGRILEVRARHELYRETCVRCSSVSLLRITHGELRLGQECQLAKSSQRTEEMWRQEGGESAWVKPQPTENKTASGS